MSAPGTPERVNEVLNFIESIDTLDEARLISRLVREQHDKIEHKEIVKKLSEEDWKVGDVLTWNDKGHECRGPILSLGRTGTKIKVRDVTRDRVWDVHALVATRVESAKE